MKKNILVLGLFCFTLITACEPDRRTAQNTGFVDTATNEMPSEEVMKPDIYQNDSDAREKPGIYQNDFVLEAASANMMEVELGKIAQEKAANQEVKNFGNMMVKDHGQANDRLKTIAQNKNIQLPQQMQEKHQETVNRFRNMQKGKEFDKEYVKLMVEDHQKDIEKFEDAQKNVQDRDIKQWIDNTLPTLRKHKEQIVIIQKKLG